MSVRGLRDLGRRIGATSEGRMEGAESRLARTADRQGLVDVGYAFADGPLGRLLVAVTPKGVVRIAFPNEDHDEALEELAATVSARVMVSARRTSEARRQLDQYFSGHRQVFDVPIDLSAVGGFSLRVLEVTAAIPFGEVSSYRDVAARAGSPRGARAAGNALGSNPVPIIVPCHRVLYADGGLGGYAGTLDRKAALLELEGTLPQGRAGRVGPAFDEAR